MSNRGQKAAIGTGLLGLLTLTGFAVVYGLPAFEGILFGGLASAISIGSLWLIVALLAQRLPDPRRGVIWTLSALVFKLPILVMCLYFGTRLPQVGLACFLATIGLVYFVAVWFLAASR